MINRVDAYQLSIIIANQIEFTSRSIIESRMRQKKKFYLYRASQNKNSKVRLTSYVSKLSRGICTHINTHAYRLCNRSFKNKQRENRTALRSGNSDQRHGRVEVERICVCACGTHGDRVCRGGYFDARVCSSS